MNPLLNPYAPGAGTPPPFLAGRDEIVTGAKLSVERNQGGKSARSFIFTGLRGVGKTVLLNEVQAIANEAGAITDFIEISDNERLSVKIVSTLRAALLKLDSIKGVSEQVKRGLRVLKSFVGTLKLKYHEVELSVDVDKERGVADSGTLARDLAEVFVFAGEAAKARGSSIVILIDEIQNLPQEEFEALIIAVHRTDQKRLPIMIVGAGLPSLVKISAEAKTYAERLFEYPEVGALNDTEARHALVNPVKESSVDYSEDAVRAVLERTKGYPYFIQEWGYQSWNMATSSPITLADVQSAGKQAINRLDKNFFRSRFEILTNPQREYLGALAKLGPGSHRSSSIASKLGKSSVAVAPIRNALINRGIIYSPTYGYATFTVPLFDEFIIRALK